LILVGGCTRRPPKNKMKNAIVQINIQDKSYQEPGFNGLFQSPINKYSIHSVKEYCDKIDVDHVVITKPKIQAKHPVFERFDLILNDSWWNHYEQILYCDTDIIVDPMCPNFFKKFSDTNTMKTAVYAKYQKQSIHWSNLVKKVPLYRKLDQKDFKERFFQTGVWSMNKSVALQLRPYIRHFRKFKTYDDGQILNWAFVKSKVPHQKINANWNYKLTDKPVPEEGKVNFIHAAGGRKHSMTSPILKYCQSKWSNLQ